MLVNSAIELYTVLLAWHLYDGFWSILSGTGLGALPFVVVIISTLLDAQEKENVGSKQLIRLLEVRLYTMLFVFFIAVTPYIDLYTGNTHYIATSCPADGSTASTNTDVVYGDSGTTIDQDTAKYGAMFEGSNVAKVPLWWYVFSNLNLAVANSLKFELPCRADLAAMTANLATSRITDPNLRNEAAHFNNQCWLPASNKFLTSHEAIPPSQQPIASNVAWLGSKYFINTAGYYDSFRTDIGLPDVPYSTLAGDDVVSDGKDLGPTGDPLGWPTCERWWTGQQAGVVSIGSNYGLKARLLADIKNNAMKNNMADWNAMAPTYFTAGTSEADDELLKTAITAPTTKSIDSQIPTFTQAGEHSWGGGVVNLVSTAGVAYEGAFALIEAAAIKAAAPQVQAIILMLFVIVLPLLMFLSLYDLGTLVTLTVVQFSIMFWSFLFALAGWMNNFLLSTLFTNNWKSILTSSDAPLEMMMTVWVVKFMYIALPMIFTTMMGLVGNSLGSSMGQGLRSGMGGAGQGAGRKSEQLAAKGMSKLSSSKSKK